MAVWGAPDAASAAQEQDSLRPLLLGTKSSSIDVEGHEGWVGLLSTGCLAHLRLTEEDRRGRSIFGLPLVRPDGWVVLVQLFLMGLIDSTYVAFKVPISFAMVRGLPR